MGGAVHGLFSHQTAAGRRVSPVHTTASEAFRTKSIATRLTEAELGEIDAAAVMAGKKVSEWLRATALASVRAPEQEHADVVLLAEIIGMRNLMLNLFAQASKRPLSTEDMRKMSVMRTLLRNKRPANFYPESGLKPPPNKRRKHHAMADSSQGVSVENSTADVLGASPCIGDVSGVIPMGIASARTLLLDDVLGLFPARRKSREYYSD